MTDPLQDSFRALSDPTRRKILLILSQQDLTIAEVAEQFEMTRAAIKKHLTILEEGQLISVRARGRERINRLEPQGLKSVADWFDFFNHFWDQKLSNLKIAIENENNTKSAPTSKQKRKRK